MTSGDELKYRNGLSGFLGLGIHSPYPQRLNRQLGTFALTNPFGQTIHGSNMIVNVALRNWEFLAKLGISACHFFDADGIGAFCNVRQPMKFGTDQPDFDPGNPAVLTFYAGFPKPGTEALQQAAEIRWELLSKSYAEIEQAIRRQMTKMFGEFGFDDERDIAGITVNRWGHSYIVSPPGFFFGKDGNSPPMDVVRKGFGNIAFGHGEHNGLQEWFGAVENGENAYKQISQFL